MDTMTDQDANTRPETTSMAASLVAAYISKNSLPAADLPGLLVKVHSALASLSAPHAEAAEQVEKATPAQIRKSITLEALISFIDGKPYKTLKRHLTTNGFTFESYRARYGLPADYPTFAARYSAARSALAKDLGLDNRRKAVPATEAASAPDTKPKRASRSRKVAEPA